MGERMSVDKLYEAVKSGRVKMDDLNDEGVKELKNYVSSIRPETYGDSSQSSRSLTNEKVSMMKQEPNRVAASSIPENTTYKQYTPNLQQEKIDKMKKFENAAPAKHIPEPEIQQQPLWKKVVDSSANAIEGFYDSVGFGLQQEAQRRVNDILVNTGKMSKEEQKEIESNAKQRQDTTSYKVGQFAGYIPPGAMIEKGVAKGLSKMVTAETKGTKLLPFVSGGLAGGLEAATQEGADVAFRQDSFDPLNVALGVGVGGAIGVAAPFVSKKASEILERWKPKSNPQTQTQGAKLALPEPRQRGNVNNAKTPDVVVNPHTFKLPEPSANTVSQIDNVQGAWDDLASINDEIRQLESKYQQAVNDQFKWLKESRNSRKGVEQGGLIQTADNYVTGRYGRISNNPKWYQDFYAQNGRVPTNKDLYELAKRHIDEGFADDGGMIPAWKTQNSYDETVTALSQARDTIRQTMKERGLNITDATIKTETVKGIRPKVQEAAEKVKHAQPTQLPSGVNGMVGDGTQAFAGLYKPFPQRPLQTERTISRNQVVKNMRNNLGVVIDTGRLSQGKGVLGIYKIQPEVVRSRQQGDLQVLSHEIGHHFDKKFNLSQQTQFQRELINLTNTVNAGHLANYQPQQHMEEAIAEYFRTFLVDPQQARQLAPNFTQYLDSKLPKNLRQGLEATQRDIDTWITQGEFEQAKGLLDFDSRPKEKFNFQKWYSRNVDDLNPLAMVEKALQGKLGIGKESMYKMARLSRGVAEKAKLSITRGIYDANGNKVVDGLAQIIKPVEEMGVSEKDFATYLSVLHAIDLKKLGKQVPFDDGQIRAVMQRMDRPELRKVQQGIVKWNNFLLDILVDAQVLSPSSVTKMRQDYPNYVPFMRYFDDDAIAGFRDGGYGASKGFANLSNPVKRMSEEGSTRTIINPFESMVKNTFLAMNAAAKNKVGLQLAELSKVDGAGAWVEALEEGGRDSKEHVITVFENGKGRPYKLRDPELYKAMLSMDHETANTIVKFLGGAAGMLRAGATLTPEFVVRNPMRDVVGATISGGKYGFNPIDFFKGLSHVVRKTDTFDKFISSGGAYSTLMALDRDAQREALDQIFRQTLKNKAMNIIKSPAELTKLLSGYSLAKGTIGTLRKASEVTELATKVGAFSKALNKTGSLEEAAYFARDLMDFNRAGSNVRPANQIIAFLNASLQGTDKLVRSFKENPASFLTRAAVTLIAPSVALHYWNNNLPPEMQEKFNNIPQWQKDTFFIIGIPGTGEFARIPKPFEAGVLFATGTDRFLRWMQENDPDAWKNYGLTVMDAFTPPVLITALMPIIEATTNYNFFRKAPIVPMGEQRREKKDQYGLYTSETSKEIAKVLSKTPLKDSNLASPRIIDNTIRGYTAGLGSYAVSGIDAGIKALRGDRGIPLPAKKPTEQPFTRAFFASTSGGGQIREDFYQRWNELDRQKASATFNNKPFVNAEYNRLKSAKKNMDKLYDSYKRIQESETVSPAEKRRKMDELDKQMNNIARMVLKK